MLSRSVNETTTEIVCIVCKGESSEAPNEIVLCDKCAVGYHQLCHQPPIPDTALKEDEPWECTYCHRSQSNPHVSEANPFLERPPQPKKRRILSVSASRQSRTHRGSSPKQLLAQGNSSALCIQRTLPSGLVVHGRGVVAQTGSPPGLSNRSDQTSNEPLQKSVNSDTVNSHDTNPNLVMSPVMSSATVTATVTSPLCNSSSSSQTAAGITSPSMSSTANSDVAMSLSHSDAQHEVQSPVGNSQKQLEGSTEIGQQQTCLSNETNDLTLSSEPPPTKKNDQSKGTGAAAAKHRFGGPPGKVRRPGSRATGGSPRTRTPNRTTGRISVFMKGRLQRTGTLRTGASSSQTLKSSPIMASRAPPVLPRLKSDSLNDLEINQHGREQTQSVSTRRHSVSVISPTKVQGSLLSSPNDIRSPLKVTPPNIIAAKPVSSFVAVKREVPSPGLWDHVASAPVKKGELCDEKLKESEESVHEVASQHNLSPSTETNSQDSEGNVMTEDTQDGGEIADPSTPSQRAQKQTGLEMSDDPLLPRWVVRANSTWRPEKPLTLEMLQKMSREKTFSDAKELQSLPEVPALSKNKTSAGDQSGSDVVMQVNKLPTERSSGPPCDSVKAKPAETSSPRPWDAELRVFTSSVGQLDSEAAFEKIRQQVAETKRRREAQEKSNRNNSAKTPRIGTGNGVSPSNTGGKPGSSFTQRLDEEQFSLSKPSKALHKESPGKSSGKARSVGRGIIEYSSRELQEKTLQQLFADVNRRMQSGSWTGSVDSRPVESSTADDSCVRDFQPQILSISGVSDVSGRASWETTTSSETSTPSAVFQKFLPPSIAQSTYDRKFAQMDETEIMNQFEVSFVSIRMPEPRPKANTKTQTNPTTSSPVSSPVLTPVPRAPLQAAPHAHGPPMPTAVNSPSLSHRSSHTRSSTSRETHGATRHSSQSAHVSHQPHLHQHHQPLPHQHQHHSQPQTSHHRQVVQPQHLQQLQEHHHHQSHYHQTHPPPHFSHHPRHQRHYSATEPYAPTAVVPAAVQNVPIPSPIVTVGPAVQIPGAGKVASPRLNPVMTNPYDATLTSGGHVVPVGPVAEGSMNGSQGRRGSRRSGLTAPHYCKVCGQIAAYLCSGCQRAWYCSPRCQMTDWQTHSKNCEHGK
ncbi:mucin-2-like isoform X2 [Corticium candelabrum]|uniref:mucin-2-like isoform X2 n=1 Tax=Corticium candelabrum TaxID=121492 RepID=UPI002E26DECF|nr:mucin-2-like isoform X2 [Corticium candelabrum]